VVELRGGVAIDRKRKIGARHTAAIIGDADQTVSAAVGQDVDLGRAGIERVLDQFFDDAGRPLDDFTGGDAVDGGFGELANGHADD
jgi:hypothetical protein